MGENCSASCLTKDHVTWGECQRAKGLRIGYANSAGGSDYTAEKKWQKDLDAYADARRQGIQPAGTSRQQVEDAKALSDLQGKAFQA